MSGLAILLPGAVMPAELAYGDLTQALRHADRAVTAKDLELYAGDEPPPAYSLETEFDGIWRTADAAGHDRFHLVGYSAGGAIAAAFAAFEPDRVTSLALLEPAWLGNEGRSPEEEAAMREIERIATLPPDRMLAEFVAAQLAPGAEPPEPPSGPAPDWMGKRPAGIQALTEAFRRHRLDRERLGELEAPVYFALGSLSNPDLYGRMAARAEGLFADFTLEVFEGCHHFRPPHRFESGRLAGSLRSLWERATE
jgi:pimeloyl-ACP methyl ester carboxylesterase